jgi:hypothetical protein
MQRKNSTRKTFQPEGEVIPLILNDDEHGWETIWRKQRQYLSPTFYKGAFVTKYNSKYYLQYGGPGKLSLAAMATELILAIIRLVHSNINHTTISYSSVICSWRRSRCNFSRQQIISTMF